MNLRLPTCALGAMLSVLPVSADNPMTYFRAEESGVEPQVFVDRHGR